MIRLIVNGEPREVSAAPTTRLVEVLHDDLGLTGTKYGCGQGQCGVCTVIVGGKAVRSCQVAVHAVAGQELTTIEGLGSPERPHALQVAVGEAQAFQCGHCAPGMIMAAKALLDRTPRPTEEQVRQALEGHECMCGSRGQVIRAILRLAATAGRP
jgi:nicotinate dehydrogenase subunit A